MRARPGTSRLPSQRSPQAGSRDTPCFLSAPYETLRFLVGLVETVSRVVAAIIAVGVLFVVLEANTANAIVREIHGAARFLIDPFDGIFEPKDPKLATAISGAIAAVVYLLLGRFFAALLRRQWVAAGRPSDSKSEQQESAVAQPAPPQPAHEKAPPSPQASPDPSAGALERAQGEAHQQLDETDENPNAAVVAASDESDLTPSLPQNVPPPREQTPSETGGLTPPVRRGPVSRRVRERPALMLGIALFAASLLRSWVRRR